MTLSNGLDVADAATALSSDTTVEAEIDRAAAVADGAPIGVAGAADPVTAPGTEDSGAAGDIGLDAAFTAALAGYQPETTETEHALRRAYQALPRGRKTSVRAEVEATMEKLLVEANYPEARRLKLAKDVMGKSISANPKRKSPSPKPSADQEHVDRIVGIRLAYARALREATEAQARGEISEGWEAKVEAAAGDSAIVTGTYSYAEWLAGGREGAEPEVDELAKRGARIALDRSPRGVGRKPDSEKAKTAEAAPVEQAAPVAATPVQQPLPGVEATGV